MKNPLWLGGACQWTSLATLYTLLFEPICSKNSLLCQCVEKPVLSLDSEGWSH